MRQIRALSDVRATTRRSGARAPRCGNVPPMRICLAVLALLLVAAAPAAAHPNPNGLPLRMGQLPESVAANTAQAGEPSLAPVPRPDCGPGSRPETDIQGRVPAGNPEGFTCNTSLVGHHGDSGGYKALRFKDKAGRECAYYDTTLLFPTNAQTLSERPTGVAVLDMSDPANPVQTASLLTPAMQTPHESLVLSEKRGLLAAVTGNPVVYPGHRRRLRPQRGLPQPGRCRARCRSASSATSPASRPTATPSTRPRSRRATSPRSTSRTRSSR